MLQSGGSFKSKFYEIFFKKSFQPGKNSKYGTFYWKKMRILVNLQMNLACSVSTFLYSFELQLFCLQR